MNPKERICAKKIVRIPNPEGRFGCLRLDKNEHLDSVSRRFLNSYKRLLTREAISMYPEIGPIKKQVAGYAGIPWQNIILSHGSDAAIKQVFDVFARKGHKIVLLEPTYAMYKIYAEMAGCSIKWVGCGSGFTVSKKKLLKSIDKDVCIVAMPNPNSPTGSEFSAEFLIKVLRKCQKLGILLLIDEAYYPFSNVTMMKYVNQEDNLVVTRTFSKAFGLGGCRAGFMAVSSNLVKSIQKARPMYEINSLSTLAIKTCLQNLNGMREYVKKIKKSRDYLSEQCRNMGLIPYATNTNFINIRLPEDRDALKLQDFGRANGILFKGDINAGCLYNCVRVTLGPKKYMVKFVKLLEKFMEDSGGR